MKGDTIGVVSPSYAPKLGWLSRGVRALERAGFIVRLDPEIEKLPRFTRAEDERRAENFMGMWLDPEVKAVIASTGGYGAVRLLPHLDPTVFHDNPKALVGYSDITALHLWLMRRAQLRSFHGPTVDDLIPSLRDPTTSSLDHRAHDALPDEADRPRAVARRATRDAPPAGSSAAICRSCSRRSARSYQVDMDGAILFIEETRDPMSVVDERLVHLRAAGLLEQVTGIVFGQLSLDRSEEDEFEDFLLDLISDLDVPVLMDFPAGHENPNLTIPFGTEVELTVEDQRGWIVYREDALSAPVAS